MCCGIYALDCDFVPFVALNHCMASIPKQCHLEYSGDGLTVRTALCL